MNRSFRQEALTPIGEVRWQTGGTGLDLSEGSLEALTILYLGVRTAPILSAANAAPEKGDFSSIRTDVYTLLTML
jgi:hypothetical protein